MLMQKSILLLSALSLLVIFSHASYGQRTGVIPSDNGYMLTQAAPVSVSTELIAKNVGKGTSKSKANSMGINFFETSQLSAKEFNVKSGEDVCAGDTVTITNAGLQGEWFTKGGTHDTPPVLWVDSLTEIVKKINENVFSTDVYRTFVCASSGYSGLTNCVADAQVICEQKCDLSVNGPAQTSGNSMKVTGEGTIDVTASCKPQCIAFVNRKPGLFTVGGKPTTPQINIDTAYGYMVFCPITGIELRPGTDINYQIDNMCTLSLSVLDFEQISGNSEAIENLKGSISDALGISGQRVDFRASKDRRQPLNVPIIKKSFSLEAKKKTNGAEFSVDEVLTNGSSANPNIIRVIVKNPGDSAASLEDVSVSGGRVIYFPKRLEAGQSGEIIVETQSQKPMLGFSVQSDSLGCQQERKEWFSLDIAAGRLVNTQGVPVIPGGDACNIDFDCSTGSCCAGLCRDSLTGVCEDIDGDGVAETWVPN